MPISRRWPGSQFSGRDSDLMGGHRRSEGGGSGGNKGEGGYVLSGAGFIAL